MAVINPRITEQGLAAALNAQSTGIDVEITHLAFGSGAYDPTGNESALVSEVKRLEIAAGSRIGEKQIRIATIWMSDADEASINEIGFYAGDVLFAVASRATGGPYLYKTAGSNLIFSYDWFLSSVPAELITVVVNPDAQALLVHLADQNAHPQYLKLSGGQMTGKLHAKVGAGGPGNPNNCGFVFDTDTGLFSSGDGNIELWSNGECLLSRHASGALQMLKGVRAPKGAPNSVDSSSVSGYAFAEDGDTGMFAEGGNDVFGSDLVFRIDNAPAGRLKEIMKSNQPSGWGLLINGQIIQWCSFSVAHIAGVPISWSVTLPTSFFVAALQPMVCQGNEVGGGSSCTVETWDINSASGFAVSDDNKTRIYRLWIVGE